MPRKIFLVLLVLLLAASATLLESQAATKSPASGANLESVYYLTQESPAINKIETERPSWYLANETTLDEVYRIYAREQKTLKSDPRIPTKEMATIYHLLFYTTYNWQTGDYSIPASTSKLAKKIWRKRQIALQPKINRIAEVMGVPSYINKPIPIDNKLGITNFFNQHTPDGANEIRIGMSKVFEESDEQILFVFAHELYHVRTNNGYLPNDPNGLQTEGMADKVAAQTFLELGYKPIEVLKAASTTLVYPAIIASCSTMPFREYFKYSDYLSCYRQGVSEMEKEIATLAQKPHPSPRQREKYILSAMTPQQTAEVQAYLRSRANTLSNGMNLTPDNANKPS